MSIRIKTLAFCILLLSQGQACISSNQKNANEKVEGEGPVLSFKAKSFKATDLSGLLVSKKGAHISQLEFDECTFEGDVSFGPLLDGFSVFTGTAIFRNCVFEGTVSGKMTQILGQLSFGKCRFKKVVNFQNATFLGPVGFRECVCDGDIMFQNGLFMKEANFMTSNFYGVSLFQSSRFMEKAQFGNAIFHANADFTMCRFQEGVSFDYARIEGKIDFTDSRNDGLFSFRKTELKRAYLTNLKSFGPIRFIETTFSDSLDTKGLLMVLDKIVVKDPKGSVIPDLK